MNFVGRRAKKFALKSTEKRKLFLFPVEKMQK